MHKFFRVRDVTRACASGVTGAEQEGGWLPGRGEEEDEELGVVGRGLAMDNQTQSPLISSQTKLETRERPDQTKTRAPNSSQTKYTNL